MPGLIIKFVSAKATWALRQRVLRPEQELVDCQFPGDENPTSYHMGGFVDGKLVSVASVIEQKEERFDLFNCDPQFRLRGMATEDSHRGQGLGAAVLSACLNKCWDLGGEVFWCNARIAAIGFYQRQGFITHDQEFDLPGIGIHRVMYLEHPQSSSETRYSRLKD